MIEGTSGTPGGGLPAVDQALEPEWVRNGSATTQKTYALAESFEAMLVQQLSQSMARTSGLEGEEGSASGEGDAAGTSPQPSELTTLLPQALSDSVMHAGGLGMAAQLTRELEPASATAPRGASNSVDIAGGVGVNGAAGAESGIAGGVGVNGAAGAESGIAGGVDGTGGVGTDGATGTNSGIQEPRGLAA